MKYLVILLLSIILASCTSNQFATNFKEYDKNGKVNVEKTNPDLFYATNMENSKEKMETKGYVLIGESEFNSDPVHYNDAVDQGKGVNADVVLLSTEFTDVMTADIYYPKMAEVPREGYNKGFISVLKKINKYDYHATYWKKTENSVALNEEEFK